MSLCLLLSRTATDAAMHGFFNATTLGIRSRVWHRMFGIGKFKFYFIINDIVTINKTFSCSNNKRGSSFASKSESKVMSVKMLCIEI